MEISCMLCGVHINGEPHVISKQTPYGFMRMKVCDKCNAEHERNLEMLRQNFQRQFGEK